MSVLRRIRAGASRRDSFADPSDDLLSTLLGQRTFADKAVTVQNSLTLIPVFRAIALRAGAVGSSPMEVYRRTPEGKSMVSPTTRPWQLLHDKANSNMTAVEFWKIIEGHLSGWGNAFIWKERGPDNRILNLTPISPRRVQVGRDKNNQPVFQVETYAPTPPGMDYLNYGSQIFTDDTEILHIRALGEDGLVGYSPIQMARQTLGSMMAQQEYEGRFWANDATPGVALIHPNKLQPEGVDRLRQLWDGRHRGPNRARTTAVLGENVKIDTMSVPMADAQFVEIANLRRSDIALLFGLPPSKLAADTGGSMTYSNSETESLDFVKWSLRDSMTTIESAVSHDPDIMPLNWFAKFNADDILRGSKLERYTSYSMAPHLLVDEARCDDDLPPLPDGKGQVLTKTIGPPRIALGEPVQDAPLDDQTEGTPVVGQPPAPTEPTEGGAQGA